MRSQLLRCIYYVTMNHFVTIPQSLSSDLADHGIKIFQVPYNSIEKFLPPKNMTPKNCLILCDIPELAHAFLDANYFVVASLHDMSLGLCRTRRCRFARTLARTLFRTLLHLSHRRS